MDQNTENDSVDGLDFTMRPNLKTPENALGYWNAAFTNGTLTCHHFREWWRRIVPKLMSPNPSMDYKNPLAHLDYNLVQNQIMLPLEQFIWNNENPTKVVEEIVKLEEPPSFCGKRFKMGEATYSCRDCSHDPTCVLCIECFENSEHRFHKFRMAISCGGGFCDCGDPEAWIKNVHCSLHEKSTVSSENATELLSKIPHHIHERAKLALGSIMRYAHEVLTTDTMLNLPPDLTFREHENTDPIDIMDNEDVYCTVVYNDETHTYDEVIATLPRAVDCDRNLGIYFATLIDREGRTIIKCSGFQICNEAKKITERITSRRGGKPLKVYIAHSHVIAHQNFAIHLLEWLQKQLDFSKSFKALFSSVVLQKDNKDNRQSLVEKICRNDINLWKSARVQMHHLLVAVILSDHETKKKFACEFTKCYGHMMKEFINDDCEHSWSVTSLSVQLYTVPSVARYLIANEDALAVLLNTFKSEYDCKRNDKGKLSFQRNPNMQNYKRAHYILNDVRHLLAALPSSSNDWDDKLRRGILHGASLLFDILVSMQGMNEQIRQINQHVEYELEWESSFNMQIRIAPVVSLFRAWCCTDKVVFIKAMRMLLVKIFEDTEAQNQIYSVVQVCGKSVACIDYPVAQKPISLHHPLNRLLAGLCLHLGKFDLELNSPELHVSKKPNVVQLMEPAMQTLVLVAQVQAGMWRRNGYSILDQIKIYQDPRCRREMFDQDVILLQLAATYIDPDEYLINLLNKFSLVNWSHSEFDCSEDDSIRQITTLVEEFLRTLIIILSERYVSGIGEISPDDAIKKEIIQLLCVQPMSRSVLNKALSEDVIKHETGMEKVIESVATFKKPSPDASRKGMYELKGEYFSEYNVFFYHYSREEQSKSEEAQIKRKQTLNQPAGNPPPLPPRFTKQFSNVIKIMESDVFLHVIALVLKRADNLKVRCFSESQVHRALHLIGLCLLEEERYKKDFQKGNLQDTFSFTSKAAKLEILRLLEQLVDNQRIESHKSLLQWVLDKWSIVTGTEMLRNVPSLGSISMDSSSGIFASDKASDTEEKKRKAAAAAARRAKIMAQMKSAQSNFMKENAELFNATSSGIEKKHSKTDLNEVKHELFDGSLKCLGPMKSKPFTEGVHFTCILCQEDQDISAEGPALVMACFVQKSTVLSRLRPSGVSESAMEILSWQQYNSFPLLLSWMPLSPHTSSCGHVMHAKCWQKFFFDIVNTERQRNARFRNPQSFDIDKQEYLCPLCRGLSNAVIPVIPQFHVLQPPKPLSSKANLEVSEWIEALSIALKYKKELSEDNSQDPDSISKQANDATSRIFGNVSRFGILDALSTSAGSLASNILDTSLKTDPSAVKKHIYTCPLDQVVTELKQQKYNGELFAKLFTEHEESKLCFSSSIFEMMNLFSQTVFRHGNENQPSLHDERIPLILWQNCAYTIHSVVASILDQDKTIFHSMPSRIKDCLSSLVKVSGVVGSNFGDPNVIRSHSLRVLSTLLEVDTTNLCILEFDAFGILVALTFSLPSLFNVSQAAPLPSANLQDQQIVHLIFVLHIVQILLTTDQFSVKEAEESGNEEDDHEHMAILDLLQLVRKAVGFATEGDGSEALSAIRVWNDLKTATLPFLRSCAVFYHFLSSVPWPNLDNFLQGDEDEFDTLISYLNLPSTPAELLKSPHFLSLARKWANHPNVHIMLSPTAKITPVTHPMSQVSLIELPEDYSELINSLSTFTCPKSIADDSRVPAMCLVCGEMVCSQSYCCQTILDGEQVGACTAHADKCGAGNAIFLRVRECKIVLLSGRKKGCFISPPYLDEYGENDIGLRRGDPLKLSNERYKQIQRIWLNHKIPEEIVQAVERNLFYVATPWQHL